MVVLFMQPYLKIFKMKKLLLLLLFFTGIANAQVMPFGMMNSSAVTPVAAAPKIGDFYQGGIVFYIAPTPTDLNSDGVADIGLICAIENQGAIRWNKDKSSRWDVLDARAEDISSGSSNTDAIITINGGTPATYAAGFAKAYNGGGFNDWFLPSKDGLNEMYINQEIINTASLENGGAAFVPGNTWSSTQLSYNQAWKIFFGSSCNKDCGWFTKNTDNIYNVRAVRAFNSGTIAPGAPTIVTAAPGDTQATVTFTAPTSDGGSAVTKYTATSTPGGFTGTLAQAAGGSITVTGLTNGTAYTFNVTATNAVGTSGPSLDSSPVTPAVAPDAPTNVTAVAGSGQATVSFDSPISNGGSAITEYTATSTPGGFIGTLAQAAGGSITVTGLTNGTAYTFNVTATNTVGKSGPSLESNEIIPVALAVGVFYQGGVVAYINTPSDTNYVPGQQTGIIAAKFDNDTPAEWYNQNPSYIDYYGFRCLTCVDIDGFIGAGKNNTNELYDYYSGLRDDTRFSTSLFSIIKDYNVDGYTDWYIPSLEELKILYRNRNAIDNFFPEAYWSSNDYDQGLSDQGESKAYRAKILDFNTGLEGEKLKNVKVKFRAIRYF